MDKKNNVRGTVEVLITTSIDLSKFRELCKRMKWYDANLCSTYEEALEMAEHCGSFGDVLLLANHIVEHSCEKCESDPMERILTDCCRFTVIKSDPHSDYLQRRSKIQTFLSVFRGKVMKMHRKTNL